MKLCDYGCGKEGIYQFKNGKLCCSIVVQKCIGHISKRSKKRKKNKPKKCNIIHKCDYGCNNPAIYIFNNKKYCCSIHWKSCPSQRKLQSAKYKFLDILNKIIKLKISKEYKKQKKLCYYGCDNEGRYLFDNGIFCCEKYSCQCPKIKNKNRMKGSDNHFYGKTHEIKSIELMKINSRLTINKIKNKYSLFSKIEEMRYNPQKVNEKEIQIHCKYSKCKNSKEKGGWFTPTKIQLYERIRQVEKDYGNGGCYLYCSDECKKSCILYSLHSDPFQDKTPLYTQEHQTWRKQVKKLDNNICQICGTKKDIHVHHIIPQKLEPFFSLDPINGICLCKKCHYKYGHKDGGCRTSDIAKEVCK